MILRAARAKQRGIAEMGREFERMRVVTHCCVVFTKSIPFGCLGIITNDSLAPRLCCGSSVGEGASAAGWDRRGVSNLASCLASTMPITDASLVARPNVADASGKARERKRGEARAGTRDIGELGELLEA